jgi:hypothetical protein
VADITIVGGGFSASVAKLVITNPCNIITPKCLKKMAMPRRKYLEINKIFSTKSRSFGTLKFNLNNLILHDRFSFGGNSKIWGGFVNLAYLPKTFIRKLQASGVVIKPLSFDGTGSISNILALAQLQDFSGSIYDASFLLHGSKDAYLDSFFVDGHRIGLNLSSLGVSSTVFTEKLILCLGTVQLLDLLYRSGFLSDLKSIELTEFSYKLKFKLSMSSNQFSENCTVIRFHLVRALCHLLGIQKNFSFFNFFKLCPFYIDQHFSRLVMKCVLEYNNGVFSNKIIDQKNSKFGESIHYCNMQINGDGINEFVTKISPNIIGLGMSFVNQAEPGPISNDIINDALSKLKHL